ncbi:MAG: hypothetical protein ACRD4C_13490, partial [Candidatus Acidiferrales bacterium]
AKDPRAGVPLDSDRAIESRAERAERQTDKPRGIPASLAMHIASARKPLVTGLLGAERAPREPLRALLPTAKAEVRGDGAGQGWEETR